MKKLIGLSLIMLVLVGCTSGTKGKTETLCDGGVVSDNITNPEHFFISQGDFVEKLGSSMTVTFESEEAIEQVVNRLEELLVEVRKIDGLTYEYKVNGLDITEFTSIEIDKVDLDQVVELGLLNLTGDSKVISLKESKKMLDPQGFTCTSKPIE